MLAGYQKIYLRGLGHRLAPAVHIGKGGLTPAVEAQVRTALDAHELLKVRLHHQDERREIAERLAAATGSEVAGIVGHVILIYRQHPEAEKRTITLPVRRAPGSAPEQGDAEGGE